MHGVSLHASLVVSKQQEFWKNYNTFADIGGSKGTVVVKTCIENPHLKGTVCELPPVKGPAEKYFEEMKMTERCNF